MPRWTKESRAKQREIIMKSKPWKKSTGPKTPEGKEKSARNAIKHSLRTRKFDEISCALWKQKRYRYAVENRFKQEEMMRNNIVPEENEVLRVLQEICGSEERRGSDG